MSHSVRAGVARGGVACSRRAQARTGSACRGCTCGCAGTCAPRAASREAATRCPGSCRSSAARVAAGGGRRLFMSCGRARASAAVPLARRCPEHPWTRPCRRERPGSPLSGRDAHLGGRGVRARTTARERRGLAERHKTIGGVRHGASDAPGAAAAVASSQSPCSCGLRRRSPQLDRATSARTCVVADVRRARHRRLRRRRPPRPLRRRRRPGRRPAAALRRRPLRRALFFTGASCIAPRSPSSPAAYRTGRRSSAGATRTCAKRCATPRATSR